MLVFLNLAECNLTALDTLNFPNLHTLDISDNMLTVIRGESFKQLSHLRDLSVTGNPLTSLFPGLSADTTFTSVVRLDLSRLDLEEMDRVVLTVFPNIRVLNLSDSGVDRLHPEGFQPLQQLRVLDLRGCPLSEIPKHVFRGLDSLQSVQADNYKFCCPETLPPQFDLNNCDAPRDEVSSCAALLRSDALRAGLTVFAVLALLGNCGSFVYRVFVKSVANNMGYEVFVTHLSVSDFLMGLYLAMIGLADRHYLGTYLWEDSHWRHNPACKMAGFMSLLSNQVSAFIICLITLERFLVVRFPFSDYRFRKRSGHVACAVAWVVGHVTALVPLLPATSHWEFYSQTGICIPLPVTRREFPGQSYSFAIIIVLNFTLFVVIAVGQLLIYWSIQTNEISSNDSTRTSKDHAIARRLITVVVSDFLCWFPIGALGLMAANGVPIPGEANVLIAVFVLPLNSALNPFLYTMNVILERRQKAKEESMLKVLASQQTERNTDTRARQGARQEYTEDEAWTLFDKFVKEGLLSWDDIQHCAVEP
nr:hypothetical protein BaRGS_002290 [Batillaria attramentaria]